MTTRKSKKKDNVLTKRSPSGMEFIPLEDGVFPFLNPLSYVLLEEDILMNAPIRSQAIDVSKHLFKDLSVMESFALFTVETCLSSAIYLMQVPDYPNILVEHHELSSKKMKHCLIDVLDIGSKCIFKELIEAIEKLCVLGYMQKFKIVKPKHPYLDTFYQINPVKNEEIKEWLLSFYDTDEELFNKIPAWEKANLVDLVPKKKAKKAIPKNSENENLSE